MIQYRSISILFFAALILTGCSKDHPPDMGPPVAKIGNEYIYLFDVISPKDSVVFFQRGLDFRKKRIDSYVMRDLYIREGYKRGFHKNESVIEKTEEFIKSGMVSIVYRGEILDQFAGEEARRNLYENLKKQVSGRHILIAYSGSSSSLSKITRSKDEALNVITKIRVDINNLDDFIASADKLSEDPTSTDGGNLGFFSWGQMEDSFQDAAFSLPINTLSEPVESSYGYHLIWIDSVKSVKLATFDRMEGQLRNTLYTINNESLIALAEAFVDSLNNSAGTIVNTDKIETLVENIFTYIQTRSSTARRKSPVGFLTDQMENGPLATYYDKEVTTQALIELLMNPVGSWELKSLADTSLIEKIVVGAINKDLITKHGYETGYDKIPEVVKEIKKKERDFVWQEIRDSEINDKLNTADGNVQKYYDEHKDNYLTNRKSDIVEILVSSKNLADSLYTLAKNGDDMSKLAIKYSQRSKVEKSKGIFKNISQFQLGNIGKQVTSMNVGDISRPIQVGKNWSVFKVISVIEPEYQPLESVRSKLLSDFRRYERTRITEIFESYVTDKYSPQYYYENLDNVVVEGNVE